MIVFYIVRRLQDSTTRISASRFCGAGNGRQCTRTGTPQNGNRTATAARARLGVGGRGPAWPRHRATMFVACSIDQGLIFVVYSVLFT